MSAMMKWAENELRLAGYPGDENGPNKSGRIISATKT